jgi:hypothetical protein
MKYVYYSAEVIDLFLRRDELIGSLKIELWPSLITDPEKNRLELQSQIRIRDVLGSNFGVDTRYS